MIDVSSLQLRIEAWDDCERPLRYPADDASSHEYEVKRVHTECLAPLSGRLKSVSVRRSPQGVTKDLYGFRPIPAGRNSVTNDLVNELREELGL